MFNWNEQEFEFLKNNYNKLTIKQIAKKLNKKDASVSYALKCLRLVKQPHRPWTYEDDKFIIDNYLSMTTKELAKHLNRTIPSIDSRKGKLGLEKFIKWTDSETKYLKDHYIDMTYDEIGKVLGKTAGAVNAKSFDLKLFKKEPDWTNKEIEYVKENYMQMQTKQIAEHLNRSMDAVHLKAKRMGLKKYPYTCNYHFFDTIDTEDKAYWLGFFIADGWMHVNPETNSGCVGFQIQYGDINHLKKFNKSIEGNYKITDRWRPCPLSRYKDKLNHLCCIRVFSKIMYDDLKKIGMDENKSYTVRLPKINDNLMRHLLRGYFDGDGSLCLTNKSFEVSFTTASKLFSDDVIAYLKKNGYHPSIYSYVSDFDTKMYTISLCRKSEKIRFLDYIYKDSNVYLDRKYNRYLKVKE